MQYCYWKIKMSSVLSSKLATAKDWYIIKKCLQVLKHIWRGKWLKNHYLQGGEKSLSDGLEDLKIVILINHASRMSTLITMGNIGVSFAKDEHIYKHYIVSWMFILYIYISIRWEMYCIWSTSILLKGISGLWCSVQW